MKNLILFILLIPILSFGQDLPIVNDKIIYEKIYEYPGVSKDVLFGAAKKFIGVYFHSGKSVLQSEDHTTGLIICKGNISAYDVYEKKWWGNTLVGGRFDFTLQFEIKDGRARVRIFDITENSIGMINNGRSLENIMFEEARAINRSKEKYKARKLDKFNSTVTVLNETFYGTLNQYEKEIKEYTNDNW